MSDQTRRAPTAALVGISSGIAALSKEWYGKGPERVRTTYDGDLVVVLMHGGFTKVEQTLLDHGHGDAVIQQRMIFQDVMRPRFSEVIERHTGRKVVGFMSGSHQNPDLLAEIFILEHDRTRLLADAQAGEALDREAAARERDIAASERDIAAGVRDKLAGRGDPDSDYDGDHVESERDRFSSMQDRRAADEDRRAARRERDEK